jgi:hypothetical protein
MLRSAIAMLALCGVLACAGCYGSTEPASNVGLFGATLNGAGTTNNGDADVFFQVWPSAYPTRVRETAHFTVPGGATGPVSRHSGVGLALDTEYSFRLCGADAGQQPVCAQPRTFRMPKPDGDAVVGEVPRAYDEFRPMFVQAQSSANGASPSGDLSVMGRFYGEVDSMQVIGNRAVVHAVGTAYQSTYTFDAEACATIGDAGPDAPPGSGDYADADIALTGTGQTVSCVLPDPGFRGSQDGVAVYDAPG